MTHGITHLTTHPHTPEHNGYSKRQHRHIVETSLTLTHQAFIPLTLWSYAFATTVYLINRMPKVSLSRGSSFEKLFNKAPDPSKIHVFGCLCFPWLDLKSSLCVFLGYSLTQSVFSVLTIPSKIFVPHHVKFVENVFLFASLYLHHTGNIHNLCTPRFIVPLMRQLGRVFYYLSKSMLLIF